MVASEEEDSFRILDLVAEEKAESLNSLLSSIDIVPQEEVVSHRWCPSILHKPQQIVILAVNVGPNDDWCSKPEKHGLALNDFFGRINDVLYGFLF